jgi:hypothetical protein
MEFTPVPSAVKVAPGRTSSVRPPSVRPVVAPPPHSNPVVTPNGGETRESVVATTVVPSVSLPSLSTSVSPSGSDEGAPG